MKSDKPLARRTKIIVQDLNEETLIYDLERNEARSLNRTAAFVWKHSDGTRTVADLQQMLSAETQAPIAPEIVTLALDELADHHLLSQPAAPRAGAVNLKRRQLLKLGVAAALLPVIAAISSPVAAGEISGVTGPTGATGVTG